MNRQFSPWVTVGLAVTAAVVVFAGTMAFLTLEDPPSTPIDVRSQISVE